MKIKTKIITGIVAVSILSYLFVPGVSERLGSGRGELASACTVSSSTFASIDQSASASVLSAHSLRAWATVEVTATSTQDLYLSFDEGAAAVVGQGVRLSATTTPKIRFGRNTDFPYTGAVTGIVSSATTSVLVTECRY